MTAVVTGSAGHLGEALVRVLRAAGEPVRGVDRLAGPFTDARGSITDRDFVRGQLAGASAVYHAATLHKPHVATHPRGAFLDTNITGTLVLLEEAAAAGVSAFVFTSTTSAFGRALVPAPGAPAVWVDEDLVPAPKNIYGATKVAAEDLCELVHRDHGLPCVVLRTSRFFLEPDDLPARRAAFADENLKVNELLNRRADLEDLVAVHRLAAAKAPEIGFGRFVCSATTPFRPGDRARLRGEAPAVLAGYHPEYEAVYAARGWTIPADIPRVYDNSRAREVLGWRPRYDFGHALRALAAGEDPRSDLARTVGDKGYHRET